MSERIIIGTKLHAKAQPTLGLVGAIAEEIDGKLFPITEEGFCPTRQVFIVGRYEEIDAKFREGELFRLRVDLSQTQPGQEKFGPQCLYKALGHAAEKLQPNEVAEILHAELPDRNHRRLNVNSLPGTKYILIQNHLGDCYGPFEWEDKGASQDDLTQEIELKIITGGGLGSVGRTRQISHISESTIDSNAVKLDSVVGRKTLVQNVVGILAGSGFEEYANDKEIIDYVKTMAGEIAGRTVDRKSLATLATMASNSKQGAIQLSRSRIALFNKIVASSADLLDDMNVVCSTYLKNGDGTQILEDYVQANRGKYIEQLKREREVEFDERIKRRQDDLNQIENDIEVRRKEATDLNDAIVAKRKTLEEGVLADQKAYVEKVSKEHQQKIADMNTKEEAAKSRLAEIELRVGTLARVDEIETACIAKQAVLEHIQRQVDATRTELSSLKEENRKEEDDIRKKLRSMKPYVDHLNGSFNGESPKIPVIQIPCSSAPSKGDIHDQRSVIDSVQARLRSLGRSLDDQEVANLLISTQQSFITFFAGLPGVGKTSMCKLLAEAQGIEKRLLSVSVARGWTSIKDMIGFHNPLNDRFQPASTGMYEFLRAMDTEFQAGTPSPMAYILLDEANLSSIEHYWSAFMGMADATTDQALPVGQSSLVIPRCLRFVATINYDGTTEPLSPRILNRATVIVMRPGELTQRQHIDESILQSLPVTSESMDAMFGLFDEAPEFEIGEKSALDAIREVLSDPASDKGRSIHISQRKDNAIRQYCGRARPIMRSNGNEVTALDWAVMQHVLPQVTGHGSKFGNRLLALKKRLEDHGLEMSAGYLDQMISHGQNDLHSYEFFCW